MYIYGIKNLENTMCKELYVNVVRSSVEHCKRDLSVSVALSNIESVQSYHIRSAVHID